MLCKAMVSDIRTCGQEHAMLESAGCRRQQVSVDNGIFARSISRMGIKAVRKKVVILVRSNAEPKTKVVLALRHGEEDLGRSIFSPPSNPTSSEESDTCSANLSLMMSEER